LVNWEFQKTLDAAATLIDADSMLFS
jgi:hypothetical protein